MERTASPVWIDLSTHDIEGAVNFYSQAFGWEIPEGSPEFGGYRMASRDGHPVAGLMSSRTGPDGPTEEPQSPTTWTVYLGVDDCASAAADVAAQGGSVLSPAMDVGDLGTMAIVADPAGAVVGLWEAGEFAGFTVTGKPGTPVWFEVMSTDFDVAAPYYENSLGWNLTYMGEDGGTLEQAPTDGIRYATDAAGDQATAGICEADSFLPEGVSGYWRPYLGVEDTDAAVATITGLGGALLDGPMDSPFGRVATVTDPQGASFQIVSVNR